MPSSVAVPRAESLKMVQPFKHLRPTVDWCYGRFAIIHLYNVYNSYRHGYKQNDTRSIADNIYASQRMFLLWRAYV